jgi:hypothetical protein
VTQKTPDAGTAAEVARATSVVVVNGPAVGIPGIERAAGVALRISHERQELGITHAVLLLAASSKTTSPAGRLARPLVSSTHRWVA